MQFLSWDQEARNQVDMPPTGFTDSRLVAVEFDHTQKDQLFFEEDDIRVFSNPAFHYDSPGPVSLQLEWNGLKITYSGEAFTVKF